MPEVIEFKAAVIADGRIIININLLLKFKPNFIRTVEYIIEIEIVSLRNRRVWTTNNSVQKNICAVYSVKLCISALRWVVEKKRISKWLKKKVEGRI